jgi:translation initiation factor 1
VTGGAATTHNVCYTWYNLRREVIVTVMRSDSRVVYATGIGRIRYCRNCHEPEDACRCRASEPPNRPGMPLDGIVRISLDRKGRSGKGGTLIVGLPQDEALLADLCQTLKRLCGSGGTSKQGEIFIQGDHRDVIEKKLIALGYRTKRAGGN